MAKSKNKIELLSPAGNMRKLKTALAFGADAVYVGMPDFSLRVRINDFDLASIKEAKKYCVERSKKIYATINIFAHNRHFINLKQHIIELKKIKVDALIVSDPGILKVVKTVWPEAEIHLSTQANCTNYEAAKFWQGVGVKRIILGRELALEEIKEIHNVCPDLELEYFVHGAMCMAYSGRCFLSRDLRGRSANLGDCAQPCRWEFGVKGKIIEIAEDKKQYELVEEKHGSYILNSKDLCLIRYLRALKDVGVSSFKIEGRAKSVYYQAMIAGIYSQALVKNGRLSESNIEYYENEMKTKLVNRGYTAGFLLGDKGEENVQNSHNKCAWEFCGQVLKNKKLRSASRVKTDSKKNYITVKVHNTIKRGDTIEIVRPFYDIINMTVKEIKDWESGDKIIEAHGGQDRLILLEVNQKVPEYSVIRRKLT